jgi:hypothetical protein
MSGPKIYVYNVTPAMDARWRSEALQRLRKLEVQWKNQRQRMLSCLATYLQQADGVSISSIQESIAMIDQRFKEFQDPNAIHRLARDIYKQKANFGFITEEIERLREQVSVIVAQAHQRERSMQAAIQELAAQLASAGLEEDRARLLQSPSDTALHQATEALKRARQNETDRAFPDAIAALGPIPSAQILPKPPSDPELARVDQQIVRLELLDDGPSTQALRDRLRALESITNLKNRRLLLDSLVLEISDAVKRKNENEQLHTILDELEARLDVFDAPPQSLIDAIDSFRQKSFLESAVVELRQQVENWCHQEGRRLDGLQVRSLVLGSLRNLGYDVREGMQTGWVEGGSIVLQKPGSSDYAVELQDMDGKLRSRVVRFGDPASPVSDHQRQRDGEMEQQWCQTQAQALATLRDQGVDAKIMAKREPGEVPLAVIRRMDSGRAARGITDPVKKTLGPN